MLTQEQFIYKLMEATEETYPEVSQVCYDFLENLSEDIELSVSCLSVDEELQLLTVNKDYFNWKDSFF